MKKLWFKNKLYGWGWTPASKEGWAVLALWLAALLSIIYLYSDENGLTYFGGVWVAAITIGLILICAFTGEKPRWRWGK
jgi:peptidoglycan/LPS O-acetylase OafA/YrhL